MLKSPGLARPALFTPSRRALISSTGRILGLRQQQPTAHCYSMTLPQALSQPAFIEQYPVKTSFLTDVSSCYEWQTPCISVPKNTRILDACPAARGNLPAP